MRFATFTAITLAAGIYSASAQNFCLMQEFGDHFGKCHVVEKDKRLKDGALLKAPNDDSGKDGLGYKTRADAERIKKKFQDAKICSSD